MPPTPPSVMAGHVEAEPAKKFPTLAVVILSLGMVIHSYTLVSLFPYVGMMVKDLLSLETTNEAGFYAGYVASAFTFGRFVSGYVWGKFTDSVGRKPTIVIALISTTTFSLTFGFSTSYTWAITSRLVLGLTNGIVPALRATLNEVCGPQHVVLGMIFLNSCKSISLVFGTGIGGLLAQPAVHFPGTFSTTGLFGRHPYLLPNLVGACFAVLILALVVVYLPETKDYAAEPAADIQERRIALQPLNGDRRGKALEMAETTGSGSPVGSTRPTGGLSADSNNYEQLTATQANEGDDTTPVGGDDGRVDEPLPIHGSRTPENRQAEGEAGGEEEEEPGIFGRRGLLATPHVKSLLVIACIVQTLLIGFEEAYPLFALSTPDVGGLGWNTVKIGKVLLVTGLLMSLIQLLVVPPVIKLVGIATWQRLGSVIGIPAFIAVPSVTMLSWNYSSLFAASVTANTLVFCSLAAMNLALCIGSTTLVSSSMRGKLGGLFNMAENLGRFLGPAGFAVTYAWSISPSGIQNHHFVFFASAALLALCAVLAWPTLTAENLIKRDDREERDVVVTVRDDDSGGIAAGGVQAARGDFDDSFVSTTNLGKREADMV